MHNSFAHNEEAHDVQVTHASPSQLPAEDSVDLSTIDTNSQAQFYDYLLPENGRTSGREGCYARIPMDDSSIPSTHSIDAPSDDVSNRAEKAIDLLIRPSNISRILKLWIYEIISLVVSVLSFWAIMVVLEKYDGQSPPESVYLNVNTLVAIFSTIMRTTMAYIVAEVIGQSKWSWMESPRPLRHVERFHDASIGAWGSLKLLFLTWKPVLAIGGAWVVIASNAIGPFSQQAATTNSCVDSSKAGLATLKFNSGSTQIFDEPAVAGVAVNGLMYGATDSSQATSSLFKCGSFNCTFGPSYPAITHTSVGLCNSCEDVNYSLKTFDREDNSTYYQFSEHTNFGVSKNRSDYQHSFDMRVELTALQEELRLAKKEPTWRNTTVTVIMLTRGCMNMDCTATVAANCTIFPCVRNYNTNVTNGLFQESVVSQSAMEIGRTIEKTGKQSSLKYIGVIEPCYLGLDWYGMSNMSSAPRDGTLNWTSWKTENGIKEAPGDCLRFAPPETFEGLPRLLNETITGVCKKRKTEDYWGRSGCDENKWWIDAMYNAGNSTFATFYDAFNGMATAMTYRMRTKSSEAIRGIETRTYVCLEAEWTWLIYPGVLLILTTALLMGAIVQSCLYRDKQPVWKSAILPLLFYDVRKQREDGKDDALTSVPLLQLNELASLADKTFVRFDSHVEAPGFIVEKQEPIS